MLYNMMLLIIIFLITTTLQIEHTQTPLLRVVYTTDTLKQFQELSRIVKATAIGEFVGIDRQECSENSTCPIFTLYDPFGGKLEEYKGEGSIDRYLEIIERFIDLNNYPLRKAEGQPKIKLADQELSQKIFKERRRLVELERSEDWEKAASFKRKASHRKPHEKAIGTKTKKPGHLQSESQQEHKSEHKSEQVEEPAKPTKNEKTASRFIQVQHVWRWRLGFVMMTLGLLVGMKYLKKEEQRIGKISTQVKVHQQESENLNE